MILPNLFFISFYYYCLSECALSVLHVALWQNLELTTKCQAKCDFSRENKSKNSQQENVYFHLLLDTPNSEPSGKNIKLSVSYRRGIISKWCSYVEVDTMDRIRGIFLLWLSVFFLIIHSIQGNYDFPYFNQPGEIEHRQIYMLLA